ncbi:unnamed protein product [Ixodes pacificus]
MPTGAKARQTSKPQKRQLPPLAIEDYKVVVRPLDGLSLGAWGPDQVYRAIKLAAKLTPLETAEIKTRLRKDQNLAVVSTPSVDTLERLCNISSHRTRRKAVPSKTLRRRCRTTLVRGSSRASHLGPRPGGSLKNSTHGTATT